MPKFHNPEMTMIEMEDGSIVPIDTGNTDYLAFLESGQSIDPYKPPLDRRTYRQKRAQRYVDELSVDNEVGAPITAIGDTLDDIVAAFVNEFPDYADPRTEKGRSAFGKRVQVIAKIKREVPKP